MAKAEKQIGVTFKLPESLHRRLREWTNKRGLKLKFVAVQAITEKLERES